MTSYNYSYNVLINRLEAFAAGHFLIKRFTHGQIDLADQLQDDQYPFMHVTPDTITPIQGGMQFGFLVMFADIPRDKEYKAEYQREVISDCIRLGQDLIAEVRNGLELFGFDVQLVNIPTFEPFIEEYKNTVTGVAFTLTLEVPWDWSACDIPAVWAVGGSSSGGSGTGYGLTLRTNGVDNAVQNILDLVEGTNVTITDNGDGSVTIDAAGGGGGEFVSTEWNANHTTATGNPYLIGDRVWYNGNVYRCIANNDGLLPTNTSYWTLQSVGYRLRQTPVDWNATSGDYQILNKPTIPATPTIFQYEIHVSQIDGNDTTGNGTLVNPVATITKALTLITGLRRTIIIHPGNYTESPSITVQYTVLTTFELLGGNTLVSGTISTSTGCTISGVKMTNLTITAPTGTGNVNVLNCEVSGTLTKSSTADYTLIRLCDIATTSITGSGLVAVFGGNPNFVTVNNASARVIIKTAVTVAPVLTAGSLSLVDSIVVAAVTNAFTSAAGTFTTLANSQFLVSALNNVAPIILNGFYSIINCIFDKPASTLVALSGTGGSLNSIVYSQFINADKFIKQGGTASQYLMADGSVSTSVGGVTSVALTVPPAFSVTGSPITTAGTLAITGAGLATQYVRGDGQLANFPTTSGGGSSVSYYLNGSINQGTIGGSTYYQMSKTAILGAGTDFTRTNAAGNGLIAQFITDANDPNVLLVPGGNFNLELYFSASSSGSNPSFYVELYKYDGSTFTLLATDVATPESITQGTVIDAYFTALAVPATVMTLTDRLALRVFVTTSGRTLVLHTENSHLCQVITTLSTGINAINGLTSQVQNLAVGTSGTDFGINSAGSTHTFNLPTASAANRGALSSADWSTFNGKQNSIGLTTVGTNLATLPNPSAVRYLRINGDNTVSALTLSELKSDLGIGVATLTSDFITSGTAYQNITGLSFAVSAGKTYKWRATIIIVATGIVNGMLSTNGPTGTTVYRFTIGTGGTTNTINNGSANNTGSAVSISTTQRIASADGIYIATANGTVSMSVIASVNALVTIKAGSIVEFEEVA
jgi:hypothetical protein